MRLLRITRRMLPAMFVAGSVWAVLASPIPGEWEGTADFGTIAFTVKDDGTAITKIKYDFEEWRCGNVTRSGGATISGSWPIRNDEIDITNQMYNLTMTISGTFDSAGNEASGAWVADSYGTVCRGTWQATPLSGVVAPTAIFTADPKQGPAPLTVTFDASASYDSDGTIQSYDWDFGDGETGSGVTANHTYETGSL